MNLINKAQIGLLVGSLFLLRCATIVDKDSKNKEISKSRSLPSPLLEPYGEQYTTSPTEIWSPGQRRMMGTYYFLTAEQLAMSGKMQAAQTLYEASYNLDPNGFTGAKMVASVAANGDIKNSRLQANRMALLYPKDANINFLYGRLLLASGEVKEAGEYFQKTLKLDASVEGAYLALIEINIQDKKFKEAQKVALQLTKTLPWSLNGWIQLTRVYLLMEQKIQALGTAQHAYEIDSNQPELILLYALTLEINSKTSESVALFEQLFRQNPHNENVLNGIIELYRKIGDLSEVLKLIDSMKYDINNEAQATIMLHKAFLLWETGKQEEGVNLIIDIGLKHPNSDRIQYVAGWAYEQKKEFLLALSSYENLPEDSKYKNFARIRQAIIYKTQKDFKKALAIMDQMVKKKEADDPDVVGFHASLYADIKEFTKAVQLIDNALGRKVKSASLLFMKGVLQEQDGKWQDSTQTMQTLLDEYPKHAEAMNFLGYLWAEHNTHLNEAEALLLKAIEIKPNSGHFLDSLGWVYFQLKQYEKSLEYLNKALTLEPNEGVILEHLGDLHIELGKKAEALEFYQRASEGEMDPRDRKRLEDKLNKYGLPIPKTTNKSEQ